MFNLHGVHKQSSCMFKLFTNQNFLVICGFSLSMFNYPQNSFAMAICCGTILHLQFIVWLLDVHTALKFKVWVASQMV